MPSHMRAFARYHSCQRWLQKKHKVCPWHDPPTKEQEDDPQSEIGIGEKVPAKVADDPHGRQGTAAAAATVEVGVREPLADLADAVARSEALQPATTPPPLIAVSPNRVLQLQEAHNETQGVPNDKTFITQGTPLHNESQGVRGTGRFTGKIGDPLLARFLTPAVVRNMAIRGAVTGASGQDLVESSESSVAQATAGKRGVSSARDTKSDTQKLQESEAKAAVGAQAAKRSIGSKGTVQGVRFAQSAKAVTPRGRDLTKLVGQGMFRGEGVPLAKGTMRGRGGMIFKAPTYQPISQPPGGNKFGIPPQGAILETDSGPVYLTEDEMNAAGHVNAGGVWINA